MFHAYLNINYTKGDFAAEGVEKKIKVSRLVNAIVCLNKVEHYLLENRFLPSVWQYQ